MILEHFYSEGCSSPSTSCWSGEITQSTAQWADLFLGEGSAYMDSAILKNQDLDVNGATLHNLKYFLQSAFFHQKNWARNEDPALTLAGYHD